MKFKINIGQEFEISIEIIENRVILEKIFALIVILIAIGVFSSAAYGVVSGDYLVFERFLDTLYKAIKAFA